MSIFRFQKFSVQQQQSAMKICTDSLLFGAMAPVKQGDRVLDIGAGTGVLSLMAAQLGAAKVTAVELVQEAYQEACVNFSDSPWADRFEAVHCDIQGFAGSGRQYDLVICNPPFFENHYQASDTHRNMARHNDQLSFADLINSADELLAKTGLFYLLLPVHAVERFVGDARYAGFYLIGQTDYRGLVNGINKVSALTFSRSSDIFYQTMLTIYESAGLYTQHAERYLSPFLLRFQ